MTYHRPTGYSIYNHYLGAYGTDGSCYQVDVRHLTYSISSRYIVQ